MRDTESLVQVHMADINTEFGRITDPKHCVQVGAVEVNLSTIIMHEFANFADSFFEYAMCGWVCDHQCRQRIRIRRSLSF